MVYKRPENDEEESTSNDFEQMLNESFGGRTKRLNPGEKIRCEVLSVGKDFVIVATGGMSDGFVPANTLLDEGGQSKVKSGDFVELYVTYVKGTETYLSPNPTEKNLADNIQEAFQNNMAVDGKVDAVNKGGFDVTVLGKRAFCPIGQMDLKRIDKPEDYIGKRFEFRITQLTNGGRNIVVSRRKLLEAEQGMMQASFADQRKPGDVVSGTVTRLEKFGAFVEIAPGIEGLAHISEISWTRIKDPSEVLEVGMPVSAKILRIENEGNRLKISLSLKQSENEPWQNLPDSLQSGSVVQGKVTRCLAFGAFVELVPGIEGLIPLSELVEGKRVQKAEDVVKEGQMVSVMVKEINPQAKRISLSLKAAAQAVTDASEAQDIQDFQARQKSKGTSSFGTLGAQLQAALERKKK